MKRLAAPILLALTAIALPAAAEPARLTSGEVLQRAVAVDELYMALLRRHADPEGLAYWTARLANGEPLDALTREIMASPEYRAAHGK